MKPILLCLALLSCNECIVLISPSNIWNSLARCIFSPSCYFWLSDKVITNSIWAGVVFKHVFFQQIVDSFHNRIFCKLTKLAIMAISASEASLREKNPVAKCYPPVGIEPRQPLIFKSNTILSTLT